MSLSRFPLRFRFFAIPALILASASAGAFANVGDELVKNSPFLPEGYQPPRPPDRTPPRPTRPPEERPLDKLEFRSIAKLSGETTFSLFDPTEKRGFWLTVNQSEGGFTLVEYKEKEDSVVVRHDGRTRVIPLRESKVVAIADAPATRPAPTPTAAPAAEAANPEERMQNLAEEIRRRREIRRALIEQNEANNAQGGQNAQN